MKTIAVIPARYASTRFPAKLMQDLGGKTVILRTYEAAKKSNLFDDVFVVTDSDLIFDESIRVGEDVDFYQRMFYRHKIYYIEEREREVPSFKEEDIILVMQQSSSSREKAIMALTDTKGDIAQAILNLTT